MGWLLTIWLSLPLVESDVEIRMWFSRESYCTFAQEKFLENPMMHVTPGADPAQARVKGSECRALREDETALVPPHMRD